MSVNLYGSREGSGFWYWITWKPHWPSGPTGSRGVGRRWSWDLTILSVTNQDEHNKSALTRWRYHQSSGYWQSPLSFSMYRLDQRWSSRFPENSMSIRSDLRWSLHTKLNQCVWLAESNVTDLPFKSSSILESRRESVIGIDLIIEVLTQIETRYPSRQCIFLLYPRHAWHIHTLYMRDSRARRIFHTRPIILWASDKMWWTIHLLVQGWLSSNWYPHERTAMRYLQCPAGSRRVWI